jgi:hypothetical protein
VPYASSSAHAVFPAPAIPCSSTAVCPLRGASAALAAAIAPARPTNRSGSGGKYAIAASPGSSTGLPRGTGNLSPAARAPNTPGVPSDTDPSGPAVLATALAAATSTGWPAPSSCS